MGTIIIQLHLTNAITKAVKERRATGTDPMINRTINPMINRTINRPKNELTRTGRTSPTKLKKIPATEFIAVKKGPTMRAKSQLSQSRKGNLAELKRYLTGATTTTQHQSVTPQRRAQITKNCYISIVAITNSLLQPTNVRIIQFIGHVLILIKRNTH